MFKLIRKALIPLALFVTTVVFAQNLPHFDHIIIVFQENRTPDNLFGSTPNLSLCGAGDPFEPGVDIVDCGTDHEGNNVRLKARLLEDPTLDPGHFHQNFMDQWDNNTMHGTCKYRGTGRDDDCFSYVPRTEADPYFQIAMDYGFANYFFQTNEGPSYPAHQFIISGTSAPTQDTNGQYNWFELDNVGTSPPQPPGCPASGVDFSALIDNSGVTCGGDKCTDPTTWCYSNPSSPYCHTTCFDHNTLMSLWDTVHPPPTVTPGWKYYLPGNMGIWNAPASISKLCGLGSDGKCDGSEYKANMVFETSGDKTPFLDDVNNCNLAPISWVIPDKAWSDHATECTKCGPTWVGDIVNAVGNPTGNCNYWGTQQNPNYQHSTAIFITWDDWGGWFDHVNPATNNIPGVNQTKGTWGAFYTYGFRVPLLVVSPFTQAGFVSGNVNTTPGQVAPYVHDFGSILNFIETNFGLPVGQIGPQQYPFADYYAPDFNNPQGNIPLQEFFGNSSSSWRAFSPITTDPTCTLDYLQTIGTMQGPDANDSE